MRFTTLSVALTLTLTCCAASARHAAETASKRPNILFIFADDQNYKTVGCYPESWPWVKTPQLDALAKSGIRFHAAYIGAWCMPSRATILTGRHPHGVESMRMEGKYPRSVYDPEKSPFVFAEFRKQGYQTAHIGKWHTGIDAGWGRDWDYQVVWNRPLHPENAGAYYNKQIVYINGKQSKLDGYSTDEYTKLAVDYIRGANRDASKPWYLWLCYGAVHGPSHPADRHKGMYKDATVPEAPDMFPPRAGKPKYLNQTQAWSKGPDGTIYAGKRDGTNIVGDDAGKKGATFAKWVKQVNECMPAVDEGVGQLIAALKESGQYDHTLIIYTADQGFAMGEHGMRMKIAPYDASYRSPLIISMPARFPQGKVCMTPANGTDLVATICAMAGVNIPWKLHGRDITPLLQNPDAPWPHPTIYQHTGDIYGSAAVRIIRAQPDKANGKGVPWYTALVQDGFKLIHYHQPGVDDELYDLRNDPDELNNLASDTTHADRLNKLRAALASELARTDAGFTVR